MAFYYFSVSFCFRSYRTSRRCIFDGKTEYLFIRAAHVRNRAPTRVIVSRDVPNTRHVTDESGDAWIMRVRVVGTDGGGGRQLFT